MKHKSHAVPTPRPARKFIAPVREEEKPDQWLDAIDPKRTRYTAPDKVVVFVRWVTAEDAREWLLRVPEYQRNQKPRSLKDFEADMKEGYWIPGVAVIAFNDKGELINGQHVLVALVTSGVEKILCNVIINRWPDAYLGYDLGIPRRLADNLKGQTAHPEEAGRALHVICLWDRGTYDASDGKGYINAREGSVNLHGRRGRELLAAHPGLEQHLFPNPFRSNKGTRSVAAMHAASYRLHQIDYEKAMKFFEQFREGIGLSKGDPVLALRQKFMNMEKDQRWRSGPTLAHILAAWNAFVSGEKCGGGGLPFRIGQAFPKMAVPLPLPESPRPSSRVH
jgi:hypothetical protein